MASTPPNKAHARLRFRAVMSTCTALFALACSGCSVRGDVDAPPCLPPAYSVSPLSAGAGETVTVTAPDAGGTKVLDTTAPMNDAGGFTYAFGVPLQAAAGAATVTAMPYGVDWCDDTGRNNRAAASGSTAALGRASCAQPARLLTITNAGGNSRLQNPAATGGSGP